MAAGLARIQMVIDVNTAEFRQDLRSAEETARMFATRSSRQMRSLENALRRMVDNGTLSRESFESMQRAFSNNRGIDAANRALQRYANTAGLTSSQLAALQRSLGISSTSALAERFRRDTAEATKLNSAISMIKASVAGYVGINALGDIVKTSVDYASIQKTFYALTGSAQGARAEMQYLREESQRLGLDFFSLAESFKGFSSAGQSAGMQASQIREIFTSVTEASAVMGLSAQRTQLALYALEQMLSKGAVSMEELRRQLGDQLPGAFQLGAKAMNMTTQEFAKLVETGKLASADFLPKFAEQLRKAFGHGLAEAIKTPRAELQRLTNAITVAKVEIGEGGFLQGVARSASELRESLESDAMQGSLQQIGKALGEITAVAGKVGIAFAENGTGIMSLAAGFGMASIAGRIFNNNTSELIRSQTSAYRAFFQSRREAIDGARATLDAARAAHTRANADIEAARAADLRARSSGQLRQESMNALNAARAAQAKAQADLDSAIAARQRARNAGQLRQESMDTLHAARAAQTKAQADLDSAKASLQRAVSARQVRQAETRITEALRARASAEQDALRAQRQYSGSARQSRQDEARAEAKVIQALRAKAVAERDALRAAQQYSGGARQRVHAEARFTEAMRRVVATQNQVMQAERNLNAVRQNSASVWTMVGRSAQNAGRAMLNALGGWAGVAIMGLTAGIAYLSMRQSEGERYAQKYAESIALIGKGGESARTALENLREEISKLGTAQRESLTFDAERTIKENLSKLTSLPGTSVSVMGETILTGPYAEAIRQITEGKKSAADLKEEVYKAFNASGGKDSKTRDEIIKIIDVLTQARESLATARGEADRLGGALSSLSSTFDISTMPAAAYAAEMRNVAGALRLVSEYGDKFKPPTLGASIGKIAEARQKTELDTYIKGLSGEQQKIASELSKSMKMNESQISRAIKGDFGFEFDEAKRAELERYTEALRENAKAEDQNRQARGRGGSAGAFDASKAYESATKAAEQLRLKQAELQAQWSGSSLDSTLKKITHEYEAQGEALRKQQEELEKSRAQYAKAGKLDTYAETLKEIEAQKEILAKNQAIEESLARRAALESELKATADYAGQIGDLKAMHAAQVDLLNIEMQRAANAAEHANIQEQIRVATARRDGDVLGMMQTGFMDQSKLAQQGYIDFFEKDIPGAFASTADAFGQLSAEMAFNTKSIGDVWESLGNTFSKTIQQMLADLTSLYIKMAMFGSAGGNSGGGGMGGIVGMLGTAIGSMLGNTGGSSFSWGGSAWSGGYGNATLANASPSFKFAQGGAFSADTGLSSYRNTVVSSPTLFAFAKGGIPGVGLMGEKSGSPGEAIMPLVRTGTGDLGVKAMTGMAGMNFQPVFNVTMQNNTSVPADVQQKGFSQDGNGRFNMEWVVDEVDSRLAQRVTNGTSRTGMAMDRTRNLNRASALYRK